MFTPFEDTSAEPAVRGFLHSPAASGTPSLTGLLMRPNGNAIALTHGAGGNCQGKQLIALADALAEIGFTVLRFDLPFRQARRFGPPHPANAALDREGIRRAAIAVKSQILPLGQAAAAQGASHAIAPAFVPGEPRSWMSVPGRVFLTGHSYGGRQASMLLAESPDAADGLLLLSYPLHPPGKSADLRVKHFPQLTMPAYFVHGSNDPFATTDELQSAVELIPGPHAILEIENAAHDLQPKKIKLDFPIPSRIADAFERFLSRLPGL